MQSEKKSGVPFPDFLVCAPPLPPSLPPSFPGDEPLARHGYHHTLNTSPNLARSGSWFAVCDLRLRVARAAAAIIQMMKGIVSSRSRVMWLHNNLVGPCFGLGS